MTINNFRWLDSRWIVRLIRGAADKLMRVADSSCRHSPVASQVTYSSVANARPPTPNAMAARKGYEATYQPWYGLPQQVLLLLILLLLHLLLLLPFIIILLLHRCIPFLQ